MKIAIGLLVGWLAFISVCQAAKIETFQLSLTQEATQSDCEIVTELTLITELDTADKAFLREHVLGICDLYVSPNSRIYALTKGLNQKKWQSNNIANQPDKSLTIELKSTGLKITEVLLGVTSIKYATRKPKALSESMFIGYFKLKPVITNSCKYPAIITIDIDQKKRLFALLSPSQNCLDMTEHFYWLKNKSETKEGMYEGLWVKNDGALQLKVLVTEDGKIQSVDEINMSGQKKQRWHVIPM